MKFIKTPVKGMCDMLPADMRLRVGYARAGRLVDEMTLRGITAEAEGPTKPRTVLISREEWRRMQENGE